MISEALSRDKVHENAKREEEALDACRQKQDLPQNLRDHDTKDLQPSQDFDAKHVEIRDAPLQASSDSLSPQMCLASKKVTTVQELFQTGPTPTPKVPANEMADIIKRYCVLTDHEIHAIVLWGISSYLINLFRIFPKLALISPEKRCGKTTTMEVIHSLSNQGVLTSNVSGASIFRMTEQFQPTLLIDEADTFLKNGDPQLVGLINSSHTKAAAQVTRCVGENYQTKTFSTWMPMVLASIGELPPTIMDRSIVITLRRKKNHEHTDQIPVDLFDLKECLREQIQHWCESIKPAVRASLVTPPAVGNDRAADNWTPMFTVAEIIGGQWPDRCEKAYRNLTTTIELELPTQLLSDIRTFFEDSDGTRVASASLVDELCKDSSGPWQTCYHGKKLTQHRMAILLNPYGIKPKTMRFDDATKRGYEKNQFADAFERYLT